MLKANKFKLLCYVVAGLVLIVDIINYNIIDLYYFGLIFLIIFDNIIEKCFK